MNKFLDTCFFFIIITVLVGASATLDVCDPKISKEEMIREKRFIVELHRMCAISYLQDPDFLPISFSFDRRDKNGDEHLDMNELKITHEEVGAPWDECKWKNALFNCDDDEDHLISDYEYFKCNVCHVCENKDCGDSRCYVLSTNSYSCSPPDIKSFVNVVHEERLMMTM